MPDPKLDDKKPEVKEVSNEQLVAAVKYLGEQVLAQNETIKGLQTAAEKKAAAPPPPPPAEDPAGQDAPLDLETMDRSQFAAHIVKTVQKDVVAPLQATLTQSGKRIEVSEAKQQLETALEKHGDFMEFREGIATVVKENPNLSLDQAYVLAKNAAPEKVKELDDAAAVEAAEKKKVADADKPQIRQFSNELPFGGLTPTSGVVTTDENMDSRKAGNVAWEKVSAKLGQPAEAQ